MALEEKCVPHDRPSKIILAAVVVGACMFGAVASGQSFALTLRWNGPGAAHPLEGSWPTVAGQQYFIETSSDLAEWSLLPLMEHGNGTPVLRPLPWENASRRFFRVWQLPPPPANRPWVTAASG